jgi:hypothetical protein
MLTNPAFRIISSNVLKNFKFQRNISVSMKHLNNEAKAESKQEKPSAESQHQPSEEIKKFEEKIKKYEGEIADIKVRTFQKRFFKIYNTIFFQLKGQIH